MDRKEAMEKEVKFGEMFKGAWKYLKPFKPVWQKLVHDLGYMCDGEGLITTVAVVLGLLASILGLSMVLSSFHLFFFITIPLGALLLFFGISLVIGAALGISSKYDYNKRDFDLSNWRYKVEE